LLPIAIGGAVHFELKYLAGPTAVSLLGRFGHSCPDVRELAKRITDGEEESVDGIICDVSYVNTFDYLNVLTRPAIRRYVIALGGSVRDSDLEHLDLAQLYVTHENGALGLYSSQVGSMIHPRIGSSYNHRLATHPVYRIIAAIQADEDTLSRIWTWGYQRYRQWTPRVTFREMILCPASWKLGRAHIQQLTAIDADDNTAYKFLDQLKSDLQLPRYIAAGLGDQKLLFDLESPRSRQMFFNSIKRKPAMRLFEAFLPRDEHVAELVIPFRPVGRSSPQTPPSSLGVSAPIVATSQDREELSQRWVSIEIPASLPDMDNMIVQCSLVVDRLIREGHAKRWFFVRYNDPDYHLRLRIEVAAKDAALRSKVVGSIIEELSDFPSSGVRMGLRVVPYMPEFQRYGGMALIDSAHEVFWRDSELVAANIGAEVEMYDETSPDTARRQLASCLFVDSLLARLGLSIDERRKTARALTSLLSQDLPESERALSHEEYRRWRPSLLPVLLHEDSDVLVRSQFLAIRLTALRMAPALIKYHRRVVDLYGPVKWLEVLSSLMHMHVNRASVEDWRRCEYIVMKLLSRAYGELSHHHRA